MYVSSFVVWSATGIWHGASWNFIVWGIANFVVLMVSEELEPLYGRFHERFSVDGRLSYKIFQVGRTFLLICCLNLFDCYTKVSDTFRMFGSILTASNWKVLWDGSLLSLGMSGLDYGIVAAGCGLMLLVSLWQREGSVRGMIARQPYGMRAAVWCGLFLLIVLMGSYGIGYDASQFIYNRF